MYLVTFCCLHLCKQIVNLTSIARQSLRALHWQSHGAHQFLIQKYHVRHKYIEYVKYCLGNNGLWKTTIRTSKCQKLFSGRFLLESIICWYVRAPQSVWHQTGVGHIWHNAQSINGKLRPTDISVTQHQLSGLDSKSVCVGGMWCLLASFLSFCRFF